jgi:hypothetical protein
MPSSTIGVLSPAASKLNGPPSSLFPPLLDLGMYWPDLLDLLVNLGMYWIDLLDLLFLVFWCIDQGFRFCN